MYKIKKQSVAAIYDYLTNPNRTGSSLPFREVAQILTLLENLEEVNADFEKISDLPDMVKPNDNDKVVTPKEDKPKK